MRRRWLARRSASGTGCRLGRRVQDGRIGTLLVGGVSIDALRVIAEAVL
jgi:hypothetical protein